MRAPVPLRFTLTWWLSVVGTITAHRRPRLAGWLLLLVGLGGLGVGWERFCGADLRRARRDWRLAPLTTSNVLTHLPQALAGAWLVTRGR